MNESPALMNAPDAAFVDGKWFTGLIEVSNDLARLEAGGSWVIAAPYDGSPICARFEMVTEGTVVQPPEPLAGFLTRSSSQYIPSDIQANGQRRESDVELLEHWDSSCDQAEFEKNVERIRQAIRTGEVYQVNLTRRLQRDISRLVNTDDKLINPRVTSNDSKTTPVDRTNHAAVITWRLAQQLAETHPAPHSAAVVLPSLDIFIASASPELFLERRADRLTSRPIKGTARSGQNFLTKDWAENVMIVDLVRNDLGQVCEYGSVEVPDLCVVEEHPGLSHLVSTVRGTLRPGTTWSEIFAATFPAGSITGAPKLAAIGYIADLEPQPRSWYCGAIGWVDASRGTASLNVAIRTFWIEGESLCFGTGGGITIDSDPTGEWQETITKSRELIRVANHVLLSPIEVIT